MATAIAKTDDKRGKAIKTILDEKQPLGNRVAAMATVIECDWQRLAKYCPKGVDSREMLARTLAAIRDKPDLVTCTPQSLLRGVAASCLAGLRLGGVRPEAYLIPRMVTHKIGNKEIRQREACFQRSYHGAIKLVDNTGLMIRDPSVHYVYEGEAFSAEGDADDLKVIHKLDYANEYRKTNRDDRIVYVWCRWYLKDRDGERRTVDHVMSRQEIEDHRNQYGKDNTTWAKNWREMASKTVICQSTDRRRVPISVDILQAVTNAETSTDDVGEVIDVESWEPVPEIGVEAVPDVSHDPSAGGLTPTEADVQLAKDTYQQALAKCQDIAAATSLAERFAAEVGNAMTPDLDAWSGELREARIEAIKQARRGNG